ncbi:MAG TPA: hypothetical protein VLS89_11995 [Candidatus Nanopelagicales bacterium]|nr:hypothetical protein [Candidatus Nanopelagicales bacterium]
MKRASFYMNGSAMLGLLAALMAAGCTSGPVDDIATEGEKPVIDDDATDDQASQDGAYSGNEENTFDHMGDLSENGGKSVWDIQAQRQEEGPPEIRTRLHSCQKLQNATLRNVLTDLGVNIDANGNIPTAGQLFRDGGSSLGAANFDARSGEAITWSSSGAAKLFDIFVQAAPEIIANIGTVGHCSIDGVGAELFDANNKCVESGVSCIIGRPATPEHLALCDAVVQSASSIDKGKNIAVGALMSGAHSCE